MVLPGFTPKNGIVFPQIDLGHEGIYTDQWFYYLIVGDLADAPDKEFDICAVAM